jgi:phosphatidylglycerol:prolipoprotein diacylglycerol transferase
MEATNSVLNLVIAELSLHGLIIAIGLVAGVLLSSFLGSKSSLPKGSVKIFALIAIPLGLIFSRLVYCAFNWDLFEDEPLAIFRFTDGGYAIMGAFLGGLYALFICARITGAKLKHLINVAVPGAVLAVAIGRLSAFFTFEDCGNIIENNFLQFPPIGIYNSGSGMWVYSVFIYEALAALIAAGLGVFIWFYKPSLRFHQGENAAALSMMLYGAAQTVLEPMRTDVLWIGFVNANQVFGILLAVTGFVFLSVSSIKHVGFNEEQILRWIAALEFIGLGFMSQFRVTAEGEAMSYVYVSYCMIGLFALGVWLSCDALSSKAIKKKSEDNWYL